VEKKRVNLFFDPRAFFFLVGLRGKVTRSTLAWRENEDGGWRIEDGKGQSARAIFFAPSSNLDLQSSLLIGDAMRLLGAAARVSSQGAQIR
jgi:hypothetical protein